MICKNTDNINMLESELYKEFPDYMETVHYFLYKGQNVNKFQTFEINHINNGDLLIINKNELFQFQFIK